MNQVSRSNIIPLLVLASIHILFLWWILIPAIGWFSILGLIPIIGYKNLPIKINKLNISEISLDIFSFGIGIFSTIWIIIKFDTSPVFSSALIGSLVSFIPNSVLGIKTKLIQNISHTKLTIYAGSFTGMTGLQYFPNILSLVITAIIGGVIYNLLRNSFFGLGGKLGSIGFGAIILYLLSSKILNITGGIKIEAPTTDLAILTAILSSVFGGFGTFLLTSKLNWHVLKASALLSLVIAIPFEIWEIKEYISIPFVVFGASFIGMSSHKIFDNNLILIASILFGIFYTLFNNSFNEIGGTLGTTACLCCLSVLVINKLLIKRSQSKSIRV